MSHTIAPGTVGDWTSRSLRAVFVIEKYGIDFHTESDRSMEEACRARNLDPAAVMAEIEAVSAPRKAVQLDEGTIALRDLIRHIVARHHEYLKLELPRLRSRLDRMADRHGERDGRLLERLHGVFCRLQADLELHLHKEEMALFPVIENYERAAEQKTLPPPPPFGTVRNPITVMENEHSDVTEMLGQMREITRDYVPAEYACANFRAVFRSLEELEADLLEHIRLENDVLHVRAAQLESRLFA